jgi:hypothetical protein
MNSPGPSHLAAAGLRIRQMSRDELRRTCGRSGQRRKWQISNSGGLYPVFSRYGRELFFRTEDNRIMDAAYTAKGESFAADKPRVWSEKNIGDTPLWGEYEVAPDGKHLVALMPVQGKEAQRA